MDSGICARGKKGGYSRDTDNFRIMRSNSFNSYIRERERERSLNFETLGFLKHVLSACTQS